MTIFTGNSKGVGLVFDKKEKGRLIVKWYEL